MRKRLLLSLIALAAAASTAASAADADLSAARQEINAAASEIKTMRCDFTQTKHMSMLNDKMVSKGIMAYSSGDRLRWEYQSPYTYVFILNNSKVMLGHDSRTDIIDVNQSKIFKEIATIMMGSVVGNCLDDDGFDTTIEASSTEWVATMIPKKKTIKQMFAKIVLHFSRQKAMVTKVELLEKTGDTTVIDLYNAEINIPVDESLFNID